MPEFSSLHLWGGDAVFLWLSPGGRSHPLEAVTWLSPQQGSPGLQSQEEAHLMLLSVFHRVSLIGSGAPSSSLFWSDLHYMYKIPFALLPDYSTGWYPIAVTGLPHWREDVQLPLGSWGHARILPATDSGSLVSEKEQKGKAQKKREKEEYSKDFPILK